MKKVVFFTDYKKLHEAIENFNIQSFKDQDVLVKLHMGEVKNKFFIKPALVKPVIDELINVNARPYLYDTTVAYPGLRSIKSGYQKVAKMHGFTEEKVGCGVVIDDKGVSVKVENKNYKVGQHLYYATHVFAISHVKGHVATGMGGAIKNFGMGGVIKKTKMSMHVGSRPRYQKDKCTYCGVCAEVCPFTAINVEKNAWKHNLLSCFGCGVCVDSCENNALTYKVADFQYVLTCAAKACVQNKNIIYLNDVNRISRSCDCDSFAGPVICPDIGFLVSDDPVAIDQASLDLINNVKKDIFKIRNKVDPSKQIKYGEEIGLGSSSYQLIEI